MNHLFCYYNFILISLLVTGVNNIAFSQVNNTWIFGKQAGLDFSQAPPAPFKIDGFEAPEGCATISDWEGNLLFYTDGDTIWNKENNMMLNGGGLNGHPSSSQNSIIIPVPCKENLYYLFTTDASGGLAEEYCEGCLNYSIIDINADGGLGEVTSKNNDLHPKVAERITAIQVCKDTASYYWVIAQDYPSFDILSYKVNCEGIDPPIISTAIDTALNESLDWSGQIKISPDGSRLAFVYPSVGANSRVEVHIYDFNINTGIASMGVKLNIGNYEIQEGLPGLSGLEFSSDNSKIYISVAGVEKDLWQIDLTNGNNIELIASFSFNNIGQLQRGPDNKIYVARPGLSAIGVIEDPNNVGVLCNFKDTVIKLFDSTTVSTYGLPNFPIAYEPNLEVDFTYQDTCLGDTVHFEYIGNSTKLEWDFGNPGSGAENVSTMRNPSHYYSNDSTYAVVLAAWDQCCIPHRDTQKISITPPQPIGLEDQHYEICLGDSIQVTPSVDEENGEYIWAPNESISNNSIKNPLIFPLKPTTYQLYYKDLCILDSARIYVDVPCKRYYIPNAFTPDNDNVNDVFKVVSTIPNLQLEIYDRLGRRLYKGFSETGWDGMLEGNEVKNGSYLYKVAILYQDGEVEELAVGNFTLIR